MGPLLLHTSDNITDDYYNQHHSESANLYNCLNDSRISLDSSEMRNGRTIKSNFDFWQCCGVRGERDKL